MTPTPEEIEVKPQSLDLDKLEQVAGEGGDDGLVENIARLMVTARGDDPDELINDLPLWRYSIPDALCQIEADYLIPVSRSTYLALIAELRAEREKSFNWLCGWNEANKRIRAMLATQAKPMTVEEMERERAMLGRTAGKSARILHARIYGGEG
jgi:hypothetical protein